MLGLVASLGFTILLVHLPFQTPVNRVGWSARPPADQIVLSDVDPESPPEDAVSEGHEKAPPPTAFHPPRPDQPTRSASSGTPETESTQSDSGWTSKHDDVRSIAALGMTDRKPQIVGGMGSLYLHINYPEKARQRGIEGRLELAFTVETDGSIADLEVQESLHPLLDSAAVKGVRSVKFVPAKHEGTPVPIRMKLPVRFQLTTVSSTAQTNGQNP